MASSPVPKDAPVMIAWGAYKAGDTYANTRNWALHERSVDGSLWAAFFAGHEAAHSVMAGKVAELEGALKLWLAYDDQDEADFAQAGPMLLYARAIDATRAALAPYPERRSE